MTTPVTSLKPVIADINGDQAPDKIQINTTASGEVKVSVSWGKGPDQFSAPETLDLGRKIPKDFRPTLSLYQDSALKILGLDADGKSQVITLDDGELWMASKASGLPQFRAQLGDVDTGLSKNIRDGLAGLISTPQTPTDSILSRSAGLAGGGTAEGLGGIGTRGRGTGASGYGSDGGSFGEKGEGGIGTVGVEPVIVTMPEYKAYQSRVVDTINKNEPSKTYLSSLFGQLCSTCEGVSPTGRVKVNIEINSEGRVRLCRVMMNGILIPDEDARAIFESQLTAHFDAMSFPPLPAGIRSCNVPYTMIFA